MPVPHRLSKLSYIGDPGGAVIFTRMTTNDTARPIAYLPERVVVERDYDLSAWARHFNVSESRIKQAVAAVGNRAESVRDHLERGASERPVS